PRHARPLRDEGAAGLPENRVRSQALELRQEGARGMEGRILNTLRPSQIYRPDVMEDIHVKAELGRYRFRGFGTLRPHPLPTGDGGMLPAEREHSRVLIYEVLPSRYGISIHDLRAADGVELTVGQGAKPGTGGLLLGAKVSPEIAAARELPPGVDQRSPARHP